MGIHLSSNEGPNLSKKKEDNGKIAEHLYNVKSSPFSYVLGNKLMCSGIFIKINLLQQVDLTKI